MIAITTTRNLKRLRAQLAQALNRIVALENEQRETRHNLAASLAAHEPHVAHEPSAATVPQWTGWGACECESRRETAFDRHLAMMAPADELALKVIGQRR